MDEKIVFDENMKTIEYIRSMDALGLIVESIEPKFELRQEGVWFTNRMRTGRIIISVRPAK